jgi:hypothetical protein
MTRLLTRYVVAVSWAGMLSLAMSCVPVTVAAQNVAKEGKPTCIGCSADGKTTPRTADGHPDLSGVWDNNSFSNFVQRSADGSVLFDFGAGGGTPSKYGMTGHARGDVISEPTYKPEFAAKVKAIVDGQYGASTPLDPQYDCKPLGIPRSVESPFEIVQTPSTFVILYESPDKVGQTFRVVFTDGRAQPKPEDLDTSYLGHSVGHWEGDTLVVDVVALDDETWLGGGQTGEKYALIHSDKEHVVERYSRNGDTLTYEATVDDPVMFAQPWVLTPRHFLHATADDEILENFCQARDKEHIIAPTEQDHFTCNYCIPDKSKK